jgi:predicted DNA-binding transcriptional regulator AlpA
MRDPEHRHPFRPFLTRNPPPRDRTPEPRRRVWTPDEVRRLGMTTDLETAAAIIGIGRTLAYDLARDGEFPVRLLRLGRRVVVPIGDLLAYLGAGDEPRGQV